MRKTLNAVPQKRLKTTKNPFKKKRVFRLLAPRVGFEPTTNRLTADCSTAELSRNNPLEAETGIEPISKDLQSSA